MQLSVMADTRAVELTGFDPSGLRAAAVSVRMRRRLGDSLRYIFDSAEGHLGISRAEMDAFLARLALGPVSPLVFGAYCDLVLALGADALDEARRLLAEITAAPDPPPRPAVIELGDPARDIAADRYRRLVDTDVEMPLTIVPPRAADAARMRSLLAGAFALIDVGNPALGDEIRIIVREIVLADCAQDARSGGAEGASSFLLWGAVVLNVRAYATVLEMVQALAHESGHNLLFGLCAHGPLHENDDAARYSSPLRSDPRPMDGIVHATYVTARMHQSVQRLADAGVLDAAQRDEGRRANIANARQFAMGMETIDRHARLTSLGRTVIDGATRYMAPYL